MRKGRVYFETRASLISKLDVIVRSGLNKAGHGRGGADAVAGPLKLERA